MLGLGLATLVSNGGNTILQTADVNGIRIGGLLFDAGTTNSSVLVQIGPSGSSASHAADPTVLSDVFARIGGATVGKATQTLQVNSANVVGDDLWLWRADHGNSGTVGWTTNTAANGLVVNGANVTMYGLAVEHYQAVQVQWNGNGGADYFYQSEMPYDPPSQSAWMDGSADGYPVHRGRQQRDQLPGLRPGRVLLLQREPERDQRERAHLAGHVRSPVARHGHRLAGRHRNHPAHHQRHRRHG